MEWQSNSPERNMILSGFFAIVYVNVVKEAE